MCGPQISVKEVRQESNLQEKRIEKYPVYHPPLWCERSCCTPRPMGERQSHPSSLCKLFPLYRDQKAANCCPYKRRRGQPSQPVGCVQRLLNVKTHNWGDSAPQKVELPRFTKPFRRHQDHGKDHVMVAYHSTAGVEPVTPEMSQIHKQRLKGYKII